jgi:hypothetical protein
VITNLDEIAEAAKDLARPKRRDRTHELDEAQRRVDEAIGALHQAVADLHRVV